MTAAKPAASLSFAAMRHPRFRWFFATYFLAMMADNIEHVISYWVMFQKFHSPALGGFAVLSHWLPYPVLLGADGSARRPGRSAPADPDRHGAVHPRLARLGIFLRQRHADDGRGDAAADPPWLRRGVLADVEPVAAP
jgi:hypothetical protein